MFLDLLVGVAPASRKASINMSTLEGGLTPLEISIVAFVAWLLVVLVLYTLYTMCRPASLPTASLPTASVNPYSSSTSVNTAVTSTAFPNQPKEHLLPLPSPSVGTPTSYTAAHEPPFPLQLPEEVHVTA